METPEETHERERDERDAESGSDSARRPPAAPAEDDPSPLGDTDQHSDADA